MTRAGRRFISLLLPPGSADGLVRIGLKKKPLDENGRLKAWLVRKGPASVVRMNGIGLGDGDAAIISLKNYMNAQYSGEIGIGTPAQKF